MFGRLITTVRGILGSTLIVLGCAVMNFFLHGFTLPLMPIWPWAYRRITEMFLSCGLTFLVAINEKIHRIQIRSCGDNIERHEKTVVIMNHRTRLDWMYFFSYLYHNRVLNRQKITLKSPIKWVPVIGWSLQTAGYIFLDRKANSDEENIRRSLKYFEELGCKPNTLIFPEGTDLSPNNLSRSWTYSENRGMPKYDFVLHPRVKGFVWYVQTLRQVGGIQAVHDITVGYPDDIVCNERKVALGHLPGQVHFHIKRYSVDQLPLDDKGLEDWIRTRWQEKEEKLHKFYSKEHSNRLFDGQYAQPNIFRAGVLWVVLFVWFVAGCFFILLLLGSWSFRVYCIALSVFFVAITARYGGMGRLEMDVYERLHKPAFSWAAKNT